MPTNPAEEIPTQVSKSALFIGGLTGTCYHNLLTSDIWQDGSESWL